MTLPYELDEAIAAIEKEASKPNTRLVALGLPPHRWEQVLRILKGARAIGTPAAIGGHLGPHPDDAMARREPWD
jgi:hypothetical protein